MEDIRISTLRDLLHCYPDGLNNKGWNNRLLSKNPYLPSDYVRDNFDKRWYHCYLLQNLSLDIDVRIRSLEKIIGDDDSFNGIILDLPMLRYTLEREIGGDILYKMIDYYCSYTLESVQYLYYSEYKDLTNWRAIQYQSSLDIVKWIIDNCDDIISWDDIADNCNIDSEIIEYILANRPELLIRVCSCKQFTDEMKINIINQDEFNIHDMVLVRKMILTSQSSAVMEAIISKNPEILTKREADEFITVPHLSDSVIGRMLSQGCGNSTLSTLISYNNVSPTILIKLIRGEYPLIKTNPKFIARSLHKNISLDVIRELKNYGYNIYRIYQYIDEIIEMYELINPDKIGYDLITDLSEYHEVEPNQNGMTIKIYDLETLIKATSYLISNDVDHIFVDIKCKFEIDSNLIEWLTNSPDTHSYIRWERISRYVHQDLVIKYPDLPWAKSEFSSRSYLPSTKWLNTKSSSKKQS